MVDESRKSRKLTLRDNRFVATDLPPRQNDYDCPSLCFSKADRAVVVMGGHDLRYNLVKSVELHNLQTMVWSDLPDLNEARIFGSSCCHGGCIYIFGGCTGDGSSFTNTIEKLNLSYLRAQTTFQTGQASAWEFFRPSKSVMTRRSYSAMVSLSDTEFVILGGFD